MLTEEKREEIRKLKKQGLKVSEIARKASVDWKTAQKVIAESRVLETEGSANVPEASGFEDESELSKIIFKKLNSGESPEGIIAEIGHVKLVIECYETWRILRGHIPNNLRPPDPDIFRNLYRWMDSVKENCQWHEAMARKYVAGFAWVRMGSCANYKNQGVECPQIVESNPYECLVCCCYSLSDSLVSHLEFYAGKDL